MRKAVVKIHEVAAGILTETDEGEYRFDYLPDYDGPPVSLTMPVRTEGFHFIHFPVFFDGLLPEGTQLEGLLRLRKIDRRDYFSQVVAVGRDLVGNVTVEEIHE